MEPLNICSILAVLELFQFLGGEGVGGECFYKNGQKCFI